MTTYLFLLSFNIPYQFIEKFDNPIDCSSTAIELSAGLDSHFYDNNFFIKPIKTDYICIEVLK